MDPIQQPGPQDNSTDLEQPDAAPVSTAADAGTAVVVTGGASRQGLFQTIRQAMVGSTDEDFTTGPIGRAVFLLAVPMVLEMLMESVFAICDAFFVSRLGVGALAAVGLSEAVITPLYTIAGGIAMAAAAMVARRVGEGEHDKAAVAGVQTVWLGTALTLLIAPVGFIYASSLLRLMGASPDVIGTGTGYIRVLLGSSGTIIMLFLINAIFRGAGDAAVAMRVLWLANVVNLVLDPLLIFGIGPFPEMGLIGAAVATAIGRGVGMVYQIWLLTCGNLRVRPTLAQLKVVPSVMLSLLRISVGGILQFFITTASWIGLVRIVGIFGASAVAGYTVAIRIIMFTILPAFGIAGASATLMGQNLGAGRPDRARAAVLTSGRYNSLFLLAVAALFITSAEKLVGIFSPDPMVIAYGSDCLHFISYGYCFYGYGMAFVSAFNGAGDTTTPTIITFFTHWVFQIPCAYFLATRTVLGASGVFVTILITQALVTVIAFILFQRGSWQRRVI